MHIDKTKSPKQATALPESKKSERRAAMAEIKRLHADDPAQAKEAARLWFEQNAEPLAAGTVETSAFHQRKLVEADPERGSKAAQALKLNEAQGEHAQSASRQAVKEWRKRNPNKVKKLGKVYREGLKAKKTQK
jgi:hypothetical protein